MKNFKADLHIHTVLSPCGDLEMSPQNIIHSALRQNLDLIAITDHNSTRQAPLIKEMARKHGIAVLLGAEVNSKEEVHCLCLFEEEEKRVEFQNFIDFYLPPIPNKPEYFGHQVQVDREELIVREEPYLLISACDVALEQIANKVHDLGGIIIPSHINRNRNGLMSQLGFYPESLEVDALELSDMEISPEWNKNHKIPENMALVSNSDAHIPDDIGKAYTIYKMNEATIAELKMALKGQKGRAIAEVKQYNR